MLRFILVFIFLLEGYLIAAELAVGKIEKVEGSVKLLKAGTIKKLSVNPKDEIFANDIVTTGENSKALVKLANGTTIVISAQSKIEFKSQNLVSQNEGKGLYAVNKRNANDSFKVATDFATIGVKGTEFVVSADKSDNRISLKNGLVDISSNGADFEIHKKKPKDAYTEFAESTGKEYQKYASDLEKEFVEFKKTFDLLPNRSVSFNGNKVYEDKISDKIALEFKELESFK
jgi:FecR protein